MSDVAIRVENLGKRYQLQRGAGQARYRTLREELLQAPQRLWAALRAGAKRNQDFWALRDVSFEVKQGEVLGVIGRNGAGKSTLLKILSRIVEPSEGSVDLYGRVGSLLEVGTGFHPELTGRENVFLSGAILGMRRSEVRARFDEIIAFAGIERFVDEAVKNYSSGMYARLGFAVAAHLDTEILLVDEVLAVGDADFKERCGVKVRQLATDGGRAVILVSHDSAVVRNLCSRATILRDGRTEFSGAPEEALAYYHRQSVPDGGTILDAIKDVVEGLSIVSIKVGGKDGRQLALPSDAEYLEVEIEGVINFAARMDLELRLHDREGNTLAFFSPGHDNGASRRYEPGSFCLGYRIAMPRLLCGRYSLRIGIVDPNFTNWLDLSDAVFLDVEGASTGLGLLKAGAHCGWMLLDGFPLPAKENGRIVS